MSSAIAMTVCVLYQLILIINNCVMLNIMEEFVIQQFVNTQVSSLIFIVRELFVCTCSRGQALSLLVSSSLSPTPRHSYCPLVEP